MQGLPTVTMCLRDLGVKWWKYIWVCWGRWSESTALPIYNVHREQTDLKMLMEPTLLLYLSFGGIRKGKI